MAPLGTALTDSQAGQLAAALPADSDRVVVATDGDTAGQHAAARAYRLLTAHHLDPRGAVLPAGQDPASTMDVHGPAELVERLTAAEPMGRQLVEHAFGDRELTWPEDKVGFARKAAGIISHAAPPTCEREVAAVYDRTGLDPTTLRAALVDTIGTGGDGLGRLVGRDRRDDLDRGQHVQATAAQLAAMSGGRSGPFSPGPASTTPIREPASACIGRRASSGTALSCQERTSVWCAQTHQRNEPTS